MKEIIAKNGYYLTQISDVVDGRIFATMIKGENVNEKEWKEIASKYKLGRSSISFMEPAFDMKFKK